MPHGQALPVSEHPLCARVSSTLMGPRSQVAEVVLGQVAAVRQLEATSQCHGDGKASNPCPAASVVLERSELQPPESFLRQN